MVKGKSSSGRQKIPIEKISKKSHLQVTFSKRRSGLFKKASELCTLCGVKIAIVVFSPADKAFSFGHPEVESIIDSYLTRNSPLDPRNINIHDQLIDAHRNAMVPSLNMQLTQILNQLEIEKKRGEELDQARQWEIPIHELGLHQLQHLMLSMEELKRNVGKYANKMLMGHTNITSPINWPRPIGFQPYHVFQNKAAEIYANASNLSFRF